MNITLKEIEKIYTKEAKAWYKHYTKPLGGLPAILLIKAIKKYLHNQGDK